MNRQALIEKYFTALQEGDFVELEKLAERAGYDKVRRLDEFFSPQWMKRMELGEEIGIVVNPVPYWSGLLREKVTGGSRLYITGGERKGESKLMKGKIPKDHSLGWRLREDVYYDPDFTAPIHWTGFGLPIVTTLFIKLPVTYTRRVFKKLCDPDHTKYNLRAIEELVTEAYPQ